MAYISDLYGMQLSDPYGVRPKPPAQNSSQSILAAASPFTRPTAQLSPSSSLSVNQVRPQANSPADILSLVNPFERPPATQAPAPRPPSDPASQYIGQNNAPNAGGLSLQNPNTPLQNPNLANNIAITPTQIGSLYNPSASAANTPAAANARVDKLIAQNGVYAGQQQAVPMAAQAPPQRAPMAPTQGIMPVPRR